MTIQATPAPQPLRPGDQTETADEIRTSWEDDPRWDGIERTYTAEDVVRLRGSVREESTLARRGAENLWNLLHTEDYVRALGAYTGGQAVQQVRAGLKAIYLSGWQVAADGNLAGQTYPDQSLYPANSVPAVVRRINNALLRQDQIERAEARSRRTGSPRSSPTPKRASAVPSTPTSSRSRSSRRGRPASTGKTSSRARRSAATSAARCSCRSSSTSAPSTPRVSRPTSRACRR